MINNRYQCPHGLIGITLIYWGWSVGVWPLGLALAVILELSRWTPWRLQLQDKDFMRLSDLTSVVFGITGITLFILKLHESLFTLAEWLPLITFFLMCAQVYSETQQIPLKAIVASLRRKPDQYSTTIKTIDLQLPYFFLTLVATSIASSGSHSFYWIICALLLWALWPLRPHRYQVFAWFFAVCSAFSLGFIFMTGISQLQSIVQELTTHWFQGDWSQRNLQRNSTAIGQIGRLKLSEEIFMRIHNSYGTELLLQQATFNRYSGSTWHITDQYYRNIARSGHGKLYQLAPRIPERGGELTISSYLKQGEGVLAIPRGSYALENQRQGKLITNNYGSIRIEDAPDLLDINVYYSQDFQHSLIPTNDDLEVPPTYRKLMGDIAMELELKELPPQQAAYKLKTWFEKNFEYSLIQDELDLIFNPLSQFLLKVRKGHCEYFATAGALILRSAGIPTRYATGYLMSEYDADNDLFIVRSRHAHAWTLAYINGRWTELDFTPSTWTALEANRAPWWQGIYDRASNTKHAFYEWWNEEPRSPEKYALGILLFFLIVYVLKKIKPVRINFTWLRQNRQTTKFETSNKTSPFYQITQYLENTIAPRNEGETIKQWLNRIKLPTVKEQSTLLQLADFHYRFRFNKESLDKQALEIFRCDVDAWLKMHMGK
ncbi:transglutaminase-like domain-containing protein [Kaarinaea lacus]